MMNITYYPINEETARRAKEMSSFSDYVQGSVDICGTLEEANDFMKEDMEKVYNDEISQNEGNENTVEMFDNSVTSGGDIEYEWTWNIVAIEC